jgi:hypothetical protein
VHTIAPCISEGFDLLRFTRNVIGFTIRHGVACGRPLEIAVELDAIRRVQVDALHLTTQAQTVALGLLLYLPELNLFAAMVLCFAFGVGNAAHMLAFSTAADVVKPSQIGTSAAIVNGIMFIVGGIMISRPGVRIGLGIEAGIEPKSLALAQYAAWPLMGAIVVALAVTLVMRETYPK